MRMQQILAFETDLLEYDDIFDGSKVIDAKVESLKEQTRAELARIGEIGGAVAAVETGALKQSLVESNARRISAIEAGDQIVVGVNKWQQGEPSPLTAGEGAIFTVSENVEMEAEARIRDWRAKRDDRAVGRALEDLEAAARSGANIMPVSIAAAKAGVTTGEWGARLRDVFGEYRAPTGVTLQTVSSGAAEDAKLLIADLGERLGEQPRLVVGKPGLDGHSNGAEQIALRARDVGFDVTYDGIRQTPAEIVAKAKATGAHVVGLSILSGSHVPLVRDVKAKMREAGLDHIPVVVGGIISPDDELVLKNMGVSAVYTPKDYVIDTIMIGLAKVVGKALDKASADKRDGTGANRERDGAGQVY
ncbi:Ethylmalonyl-CoA mutase [Methylobacterium trifolii]|uniref:Ethylmalonyl-CoA mutase n=2 Tax=Methylobacterium trifolii TaxID=1003092 RepID=A0ABQ4TVW4_9HYPH|nr:Ethylmalonyl-CoA mutase [Methylobacterium trifolii]